MSMLSRIERGRRPTPPRIGLYGPEGIGKSTLGAQAPRPIFLQTEDGLGQIACDRFPLATTLADVEAAIADLENEPHEYETLVVDSLSAHERLVHDAVCREYGVTSIEKADGGYARGYTHALVHWRRLLGQLDSLREKKGMIVILIAHAKVEKFEDPEASAYDRYTPRLHKHAAALVCEWADAVLFATRKIRTQSEDAGFNRKRTIAHAIGRDGGDRVLRCVGEPSCVAKNRYGINEDLPLSWAAFVEALSRGQQPSGQGD